MYRKNPKNLDTQKIAVIYPKIRTGLFYYRVNGHKDAGGIANCVDPDLILVYTVCSDLSVQKLYSIYVLNRIDVKEKDWKQLNQNKTESIFKTKLFRANFMQIRLLIRKLLMIENLETRKLMRAHTGY